MSHLEFTVEPFVEGHPGPHVLAPVDALRARGLEVEFGPFGSSCSPAADDMAEVVSLVVDAAMRNGAERIHLEVVSGAADL